MRSVGIKVLKNKLSQYIRIASQGETVLVTDRDRVVAEITPPRAGGAEAITDSLLAEAVRKGWVAPPIMRQRLMPRLPVASLEQILHDLANQRGDR